MASRANKKKNDNLGKSKIVSVGETVKTDEHNHASSSNINSVADNARANVASVDAEKNTRESIDKNSKINVDEFRDNNSEKKKANTRACGDEGGESSKNSEVKKYVMNADRQKFIVIMMAALLVAFIFLCLPFTGLKVTVDAGDLVGTEQTKTAAEKGDEEEKEEETQDFHVTLSGLQILLIPLQGYESIEAAIANNLKEFPINTTASEEMAIAVIQKVVIAEELHQLAVVFWFIYILQLLVLLIFLTSIATLIFVKDPAQLAFVVNIENIIHTGLAFLLMLVTMIMSIVSGLIVSNYGLYLYFIVMAVAAVLMRLASKEFFAAYQKKQKSLKQPSSIKK